MPKKNLIPKGNLYEVGFDEMEADSAYHAEQIYKQLNLGGYEEAKPYIDKYLASVKNYKKNKFRDIRPEIEERIQTEWRFAFDEWGYSLEK
ncbi:MAG: hypothetical protein LRY27_04815 [Chitinophagales bacterium]|nr:hypothetical protein [Chitinophagales bacterium]